MALSTTEQNQLKALIAREGGLAAFAELVRDLSITNTQTAALATLAPAISVTVSDWPALAAYVAQATPANVAPVPAIAAAIKAAAGAQDATKLGPLFVVLYAAIKAHQSL